MKTVRQLVSVLQPHFEVERMDELLRVGEMYIDVSDPPNCTIVGEEEQSMESLVRHLHRGLVQEQAEQAKFQTYDLDDYRCVVSGTLALDDLDEHVKQAWGLKPDPIQVLCTVDLLSLKLTVEYKQGQAVTPVLRVLDAFPVCTILDVKGLEAEIKMLNSYCCICLKPHNLISETLMLFPCSNELCLYIAQTQNIGNRVGSASLALLAKLLLAALKSSRQALICDPFPTIFEDAKQYLLHPTEKRDLPLATSMAQDLVDQGWTAVPDKRIGHWIMTSCQSFIMHREDHPFQPHSLFAIFQSSPQQEQKFAELKRQHGSVFAFHGSRVENWNSILHRGLKNASGTKLMQNGAAFGNGVYISPSSAVSIGYCGYGAAEFCIAIVEVIASGIKKHGQIWVVEDESLVQVRFLLDCRQTLAAYDTEKMHDQLEILNHF